MAAGDGYEYSTAGEYGIKGEGSVTLEVDLTLGVLLVPVYASGNLGLSIDASGEGYYRDTSDLTAKSKWGDYAAGNGSMASTVAGNRTDISGSSTFRAGSQGTVGLSLTEGITVDVAGAEVHADGNASYHDESWILDEYLAKRPLPNGEHDVAVTLDEYALDDVSGELKFGWAKDSTATGFVDAHGEGSGYSNLFGHDNRHQSSYESGTVVYDGSYPQRLTTVRNSSGVDNLAFDEHDEWDYQGQMRADLTSEGDLDLDGNVHYSWSGYSDVQWLRSSVGDFVWYSELTAVEEYDELEHEYSTHDLLDDIRYRYDADLTFDLTIAADGTIDTTITSNGGGTYRLIGHSKGSVKFVNHTHYDPFSGSYQTESGMYWLKDRAWDITLPIDENGGFTIPEDTIDFANDSYDDGEDFNLWYVGDNSVTRPHGLLQKEVVEKLAELAMRETLIGAGMPGPDGDSASSGDMTGGESSEDTCDDTTEAAQQSGFSFWQSLYVLNELCKGSDQGELNIINGLQDVAVGVFNTASGPLIPSFESSDWSRGVVVHEAGEPGSWGDMHGWSKFIGGQSMAILMTIGAARAFSGSCFVAGTEVYMDDSPMQPSEENTHTSDLVLAGACFAVGIAGQSYSRRWKRRQHTIGTDHFFANLEAESV